MAQKPQSYYRPYDSGEESDSGDSQTTNTTSTTNTTNSSLSSQPEKDTWFSTAANQSLTTGPDFSQLAKRLQATAGPSSISSFTQETSQDYTSFNNSLIPDSLKNKNPYGHTTFATESSKDTTIISIDSTNRDLQVYPYPTYCTFRFPRTYKNVISISIAELKMLTSFYSFSMSKNNTDITIYEKDRTITLNSQIVPLRIKTYISDGSYNIASLQAEIQLDLNKTPVFFDFINGFNDFSKSFIASGDFSINFNQPGDYFFNRLISQNIPNPTINTIVNYFWQSRYSQQNRFSQNDIIMAYYYPVLKEILLDNTQVTSINSGSCTLPTLNTVSFSIPLADGYNYVNSSNVDLSSGLGIDPNILSTNDVTNRCLYSFRGLADPVVLSVILGNKSLLDTYRLQHTFQYSLVNKYSVNLNTQTQYINITSSSLNTSLLNLLNNNQQSYTAAILAQLKLTNTQYTAAFSNLSYISAVLQSLYNFQQNQFLQYFAVPFDQYASQYYANVSNPFYLQNGLNALNIPASSLESYAAGIITYTSSIISPPQYTPSYWPNLSNTNAPTISLFNLSTVTESFNNVYRNTLNIIDLNQPLIKPDYTLYSQILTGDATVICPVKAGAYTVFNFNSPVRQTIHVETLPQPILYRLPKYNQSNFDATINKFFNFSYTFSSNLPYEPPKNYTTIYDNIPSTSIYQIPGWPSTNTWGLSYESSITNYTSNFVLTPTIKNNTIYAQFTTPYFSNILSITSSYTYSLNVTLNFVDSTTTFIPTPSLNSLNVFIYHDRGAFMGDVLCNRNENPYFYKNNLFISTSTTSTTFTFTTYENQTYYMIVRPTTIIGKTFMNIVPWFSNSMQVTQQSLSVSGLNPSTDIYTSNFNNLIATNFNYAQVYDSNWIQLPITSPYIQSNINSNITINPVIISYNTPIGYDVNGVSSDYIDYIPFLNDSLTGAFYPTNPYGIDPINQYVFFSNSPYSLTNNTYFYTGSVNNIFDPGLANIYNPANVVKREYKIVHYYSVNYLPESKQSSSYYQPTYISDSNSQLPYTLATTLNKPIIGYNYDGPNQELQLDRGVLGFTFIPEKGVWNIKRFVFRSAISDYVNDPNQNIYYLGIFLFGDIINSKTLPLSLNNAITVLSNSSRVTYTANQTNTSEGFDVKGGTYYEFKKDTSFSNPLFSNILGYSQNINSMISQPESMYACVGFTSNGNVITIKALSGSAVPYPYSTIPSVSNVYLDNTSSYYKGQSVVVPIIGNQKQWPNESGKSELFPPSENIYQSQYLTSQPVGTSVVLYKKSLNINNYTTYLYPWSLNSKISKINANINNHMLVQDDQISIYNYLNNTTKRIFSNPICTFTIDEIFSVSENTYLTSISGNSSIYFFLGFVYQPQSTNIKLRIKQFTIIDGEMNELSLDTSFVIPHGGSIQSFTINDAKQMVFIYQTSTSTTIYYTQSDYTKSPLLSASLPTQYASAVHDMNSTSSVIYWLGLTSDGTGQDIYQWDITTPFPGTLWIQSTTTTLVWNQICINISTSIPSSNDRLFLANTNTNTIYYTDTWNTTTYEFTLEPLVNNTIQIGKLNSGYNGSLWIQDSISNIIWGNRNTDIDIDGTIAGAWQIFYPFQKIVLERVDIIYNPEEDLVNLNYPEYGHTNVFYYNSQQSFCNDINYKWGNESNYTFVDKKFSGYYFNSHLQKIPISKSLNSNNYIAVRGYSPTESFESLLRFVIPNKYTFGYISTDELIKEIQLNTINNQYLFDVDYSKSLSNFDLAYNFDAQLFGDNLIPNFEGVRLSSKNFSSFTTIYQNYFSNYNTTASTINIVNQFVNSNIYTYISTNLANIIPINSVSRLNYSAPLIFQIQWNSSLLPQYKQLVSNWGLGYNLGYTNVDSAFSIIHNATSFYKILQDYIYLRLSPEYKINTLDITNIEQLNITRDPTGSINEYFGKLLLGDFNTYSRTIISNVVTFNPPISKLDKLSFEWIDPKGNRIVNSDCDWSITLSITEYSTKQTLDSSIPTLVDPSLLAPAKT